MSTYFATLVLISLLSSLPVEPIFQSQVIDSDIQIGYGLAIGDVDGDRKPDIILADKKQFVWYRNGDWKKFVLIENLTQSDNVCIAARDIDGDGKVEIAVGAQWNPGETSDTLKSGSVHYLVRPKDPTQKWADVKLHHEPTIHRMKWVKVSPSSYQLVVLPLHGRGNKEGVGKGVRVFAYEKPKDPHSKWKLSLIDSTMHLTHNMDVVEHGTNEVLYIGGKEGVKAFEYGSRGWSKASTGEWKVQGTPFGEVRLSGGKTHGLLFGIQPMHGNVLAAYPDGSKVTLSSTLNQGHALAAGQLLGSNSTQVIAGWREPDPDGKVGIKIFLSDHPQYLEWKNFWIDENTMACEDLQLADLDGDGKKDIIASGRSTHNLKIYWNKN